jgi:hypothetical protein
MRCNKLLLTSVFSLGFVLACGSDDDEAPGGAGRAGSAGTGGASGGAGTGGASGTGGSAGASGSGGASGSSGASGTGGSAGQDGGAGKAGTGGTDGGVTTDGGSSKMSFFVSSKGVGDGTGNLGGLTGADQHCKSLAQAAGSTKTQWVAYVSVQSGPGGTPVNAKDRIGSGPWYNAKGETFAPNVTALHPTVNPMTDRAGYIAVKPADALFLTETGERVPSAQHDILTGSNADGTLATGRTCSDWTSAAASGAVAALGHSDTPANTQFSPSWNSAHDSQNCSRQGLISTGGAGRIYCFATD